MVPINYRLNAEDMEYIINHSDAKILIVDEEFAQPVEEAIDRLSLEKVIIVDVEGQSTTLSGVDYEEFIEQDRKSTRLNSSHVSISYAVFCLKKKIYLIV